MNKALLSGCAIALAAFAPLAPAQTSPAPVADIIQLETFVVNTEKDTGYIASDSLVGGRIATNLLKTPADVSVLTSDFLADIAADSYTDAAIWLTGASVDPNFNSEFGTSVTFRGLGSVGGGYPSRNYFRYNNGVDGYITERLEGSRGPNSLLFGDGVVGGVLNSITKRARIGRNSFDVQTRFDSEGSRRITTDINRLIGDKLAVRLNLLASEGRSWIDTTFDNRRAVQFATAYRPWKGGEFRTEIELMKWKKAFAPTNVSDAVSNWDGVTTTNGPITAVPSGSGVTRFSTDRLVYGPSYIGTGILNHLNSAATTGSNLPIPQEGRPIARFPSVRRDFSNQPAEVFQESNYRVLGGYFTQELKDMSFEVAAQRVFSPHKHIGQRWDTYTVDVNRKLPADPANPTAPLRDNPNFGKTYSELNVVRVLKSDNTHTDFRFAGVYTLPVKSFSQRFNFIASQREELFENETYQYGRTNGANANVRNAVNQILIRRYWDETHAPLLPPPLTSNGYTIGEVQIGDRFEKQRLRTLQFASVGSYWQDRISLIGGYRIDNYRRRDTSPGGQLPNGSNDPARYILAETDVDVSTYNVGTVVFLVPEVGIYYNYAQNFNPAGSGALSLIGGVAEPTKAVGKSAGLRFRLAGGKVVGSLGYYNTFELRRGVPNQSLTEINNLWSQVNQAERQIPGTVYRDSRTEGGTGYEADFTANLTRGLKLKVNFAKPDNEQRDSLPQLRAYYAENLPIWEAALNDPNNAFHTQIQSNINTLASRISAAADGRKINGLPEYTANAFVDYTIQRGALKNLSFGGGANFLGQRIIGNQVGQSFNYLYRGDYYVATAKLGYSGRFRDIRWSVQLNVANLFDHDDPIYTSTTNYQGSAVLNEFYYIEPRKFTLTTTLRF